MNFNLRFALTPPVLLAVGVIVGLGLLGVLLWSQKRLRGWQRWYGLVLWLLGVVLWGVGFVCLGSYHDRLNLGTEEVSVSTRGAVFQLYVCLAGTALWGVSLLLSWRWGRPGVASDRQTPEQEGVWPPPPQGGR